MSEDLWLEVEAADLEDAARRVTWWRGREAALARQGPRELLTAWPLPAGAHAALNAYWPIEALREDVHALLLGWFGGACRRLGVDLRAGALARTRSWLEARRWLPSLEVAEGPAALLEGLRDPRAAHALLFELFAPRVLGAELGRYPEELEALAAALGPGSGPVRAWDAGCATGEGSWELAYALATGGRRVELWGTTPWPLERLMAARAARPHDPARSAALQAFIAGGPRERCRLQFVEGDLRRERPPGRFAVVVCHGLLGGLIRADGELGLVLERLLAALAPGGLLSVTDRFREDRRRAAREPVRAAALAGGLRELSPGLFRAPGIPLPECALPSAQLMRHSRSEPEPQGDAQR